MDRATGPKKPPMIADSPLRFHTTYYERFFMLCVGIKVNGEPAKLNGVDSRSLILSASCQPSWQISGESFLNFFIEAGKEYGIDHVAKLRFALTPMMEVEFAGAKNIAEFLISLSESKFQNSLKAQFQRQTKAKVSSVSLDVSLHLVVPLPDCDASVTEVTLDNLESCLQTLKEGNQFDYAKVMTKHGEASWKKFLDPEKDLLALYQETASVVQWFTLGLYLGIAGYKLEKISVDYRFNDEYLLQMLSAWLKTGAATWLSLVRALKKIGQSDLANQIAKKKGIPVDVLGTESDGPPEVENDLVLSAQQKELFQKEQQKAAFSKEMNEAKDQQQVLKNELVNICQILQKVSDKSTMLTIKKQRLEIDTEQKQIKQKRILAASTSKPSKELLSEMVNEVRLSILDLKKDLHDLELEISKQRAKEEQAKQELAKKEKEADDNRKALEELKKKQELFSSKLDSQEETLAENVQQAENRQEELNHILREIHISLQPLTKKCADLAEEKEQLEKEITKKEKLREDLMTREALNEDGDIFDQLKADIEASIEEKKKRWAQIEQKIEKQRNKEKLLKQEAAEKEKEVDENERLVHELKQKHSVICSTLETKRKIFDSQLRQKHQYKEKLPEQRKQEQQSQLMATSHDVGDGTHLHSVKPKEEVVRTADFYASRKTPVQTITGIYRPQYIAFHNSGDILVTSHGDHCVYVYNSSGRRKATIGTQGHANLMFNGPHGIAISGDTVYVVDCDNHRVQSFTTSGMFLSKFGSRGSGTGQIRYPTCISIDSDDRLYVSDSNNHRVQVFHSDGSFVRSFDGNVPGKANFKFPSGLTIAPDGNLFIAGLGSNNVTVLTREGQFVRSFEVKNPIGVAVDTAGFSLVTTNTNPGPVSIFDPNGQLIHKIEGFHYPRDVEISPDGAVWISENSGNKLYKY